MNQTISVVVITRNRASRLKDCLTSIVRQTRKPDEVVVVDNHSEDDTRKSAHLFENDLNLTYVLEERVGIPVARNAGLENAKGDIIAFIDDDCIAEPNWIDSILKAHARYPQIAIIQGKSLNAEQSTYSRAIQYLHLVYLSQAKIERLGEEEFLIDMLDTKNSSLKKKYLDKHGIRFDERFMTNEDHDFGKQFNTKGELTLYTSSIVVKHHHRSTFSSLCRQHFHYGRGRCLLRQKWKPLPSRYSGKSKNFIVTHLIFPFDELQKAFGRRVLFKYFPLFLLCRWSYYAGLVYEGAFHRNTSNTETP